MKKEGLILGSLLQQAFGGDSYWPNYGCRQRRQLKRRKYKQPRSTKHRLNKVRRPRH